MVAFLLSAWPFVDSTIGSHGSPVSDTGSTFLPGIVLLSFIATIAFGVAGINALTDAPRIGVQCPFTVKKTGDAAASDEAGGMVQWENHAVGCGGAWERELSSALMKK